MEKALSVMIMSGLEDGSLLDFDAKNGDGRVATEKWTLSIGRRDENDICLRNDTFVSRLHAYLHWKDSRWWLEDCNSTNGSFVENAESFFEDSRVKGIVPVEVDQLFRIGRTWLRIQPSE